ncbi:MAG TPA: tRNA (N6-isopentenyl adenosine(37)-C2)-methylthiotransferase MiaB [Clostridiaceae bacterium]|nr:tRNA (N6-isopentenyl adenosine(37)-C2)-methylthiotransferase MiaB [Clostridiaceae bacterium]
MNKITNNQQIVLDGKSQNNMLQSESQKLYLTNLQAYSEQLTQQKGKQPTYFIQTFGCQQNENDSEIIAGIMDASGFALVDNYEIADISIINTCSIRENADTRLFGHLGILKTLQQKNPQRFTILCGCMMTQDQHLEKIKKSFAFVNLVFGPHDIFRLPQLLWDSLVNEKRVVAVSKQNLMVEQEYLPITRSRKFRALVSIMYGCNNFCTFCIVPYTRGRELSRSFTSIYQEIIGLAKDGYTEIMLLGQNVNAWGKDFRGIVEGPKNFAELLETVAQIDGLKRIRYMSPNPRDIDQQLIEIIGKYENIEPHMHLPLQSGSDRILKLMHRRHNRARYLEIVQQLRMARPEISITTDIIVGFPSETEQDFADTLDLMRQVKFDSAFTFIYSPREGTPAAEYEYDLDRQVINQRFERLVELQNMHSLEANQKVIGQTVEVLLEGVSHGDSDILTGRTADFKLINLAVPEDIREKLPADAFNDQNTLNSDYFEAKYCLVELIKAKTFSIEGVMKQLIC